MTVEGSPPAHVGQAPQDHRLRLWRFLTDNPVVLKELRGRMRGARAFVVLTVYLLLLGAFASLIYVAITESSMSVSGQVNVGEIGRTLFSGVVGIEMMLVAFIAPAFTAGAISGEREHQTFELLKTTLLPSYALVLGKLLSSMLYVLLLLLAAIPLQSIAFFFGGVAETEILLSLAILAVTALLFSTIGIYFSARASRTLPASVLTYSATAFFMFGLPLLLGIVILVLGVSSLDAPSATAQKILLYVTGAILCTNPVATAVLTQRILLNERSITTFSYTLVNGETVTLVSPWIPFVLIYLVLTVVVSVLAVRRVQKIQE